MSRRKSHRKVKAGRRIKSVANTMVNFFHQQGIKVMRYDAISTNSIYLKLDYGLLYSVRLSDHKGKEYLTYRFNAIIKYKGPAKVATDWDWSREFYSFDVQQLNELCRSILLLKKERLNELGLFKYQHEMDLRKRQGAKHRGFWQTAQDLG